MARNGSGTYSLAAVGNPVVTGTSISTTWANGTLNDVASAITQSVSQDGQTPITANLPMTGFKHTNVANATARTEYCTAGQNQDNTFDWLTGVSGTDTITASAAIGMAAYAAGQTFRFVSAGANTTTTVTLNLNSLGAKALTKEGSTALAVGDIANGATVEVVYDGTRFQLVAGRVGLNALLTSLAAQTTSANNIQSYSGANTASLLTLDIDGTLASNSDSNIPSQKAIKTFVAASVSTAVAAVFTRTANQAIPGVGTVITAAHSLGRVPYTCVLEFVCTTAEQGYSIGDVIQIHHIWSGSAQYTVDIMVWKNATNVGVTNYSTAYYMAQHKTTGDSFTPGANWQARFLLS